MCVTTGDLMTVRIRGTFKDAVLYIQSSEAQAGDNGPLPGQVLYHLQTCEA